MKSWPWNAHVGQRVTPIDHRRWQEVGSGYVIDGPLFGVVYVITYVAIDEDSEEVFIGFDEFSAEHGFFAEHFRPVKDTSAQVEELKRVCLPELVTEREASGTYEPASFLAGIAVRCECDGSREPGCRISAQEVPGCGIFGYRKHAENKAEKRSDGTNSPSHPDPASGHNDSDAGNTRRAGHRNVCQLKLIHERFSPSLKAASAPDYLFDVKKPNTADTPVFPVFAGVA